MVVKLSVTAALDPRGTKLREESIYLDTNSLNRNLSWQLAVSPDAVFREVDSRTIARQRDIAAVQSEEIFEGPMTIEALLDKAKASSRGILQNPNSTQFQNIQAQAGQQRVNQIENSQPQNLGMVTMRIEGDQTPSLLRASNEQRTLNISISRSRPGSTVTPAVAEKTESRVHRDAILIERRSNSSRRRSGPRTDNSSNPLVVGAFTAAFFDSRSYREPTVEGFIADLARSREPKGSAVDEILGRREASRASELVLAS